MPAQPPVREPEEEMEAEGESQLPETNGEVEQPREDERGGRGGEETMEESTEERDSDLEDSEEEEEEEESSEMDDEDCERRRGECLDEMSDLEKQFQDLKEKLFRERQNQVKVKLDEVLTGKAGEYREPLVLLQESMHIRTQVAGVYRELCLQVIKHKYECEEQGAKQHLESERMLLFDAMKTELLEKIRRLEEDRQNVDLTSEWSDEMGKKCKRKNLLGRSERKKKVALVSGPFIVYMLRDIDILEDWSAIKKAKAALSPLKRKLKSGDNRRILLKTSGKNQTSHTHTHTHTHSQLLPLTVRVLSPQDPEDCVEPCLTPATNHPTACLFVIYCYLKQVLNDMTTMYL